MRTNSILLAAACTLPFSLVACGSSDSSGDDDDSSVTPTGDHHQYVVKKANVVNTSPETLSLDFGSKSSAKVDGKVDNRLGLVLNTLSMFFNVQDAVDLAVNDGSLILLLDVQTTDFTNNTAGAGLSVKFGTNPRPAACTDVADPTTCGQHLTGMGMFDIAATSPTDASLNGKVINSIFNAGPGNVGLQLALAGTSINLSLVHARAQLTGMTADGIASIKVGGLVTMDDLTNQIGPAIKLAVDNIITAGCTGTPKTVANLCGCPAGSTADKARKLLDLPPGDCMISVNEILTNPTVLAVLQPDSCSKDSCDAPDSYSIGVQVQAVKATF